MTNSPENPHGSNIKWTPHVTCKDYILGVNQLFTKFRNHDIQQSRWNWRLSC